ncbi:hypothetical protein BDF19DRAFT_441333 [Syncephalis fuscata]|nr:hypothetical protein BDF19DRAFT_441333 [Syncephalis fuscata]
MPFGQVPFKDEEREELSHELSRYLNSDCVASRSNGGGSKLYYIEGWKAINLANDIWGFDGWSSSIVEVTIDYIDNVNGRISVGVSAIVRVTIKNGTHHEDIGFGVAENMKSKGMALEKAKKEAVTDGLKRALRGFGNVLGNCLYDKNYIKAVTRMPPPKPTEINPELAYQFKFHGGQRVVSRTQSHAIREASRPYPSTSTSSVPKVNGVNNMTTATRQPSRSNSINEVMGSTSASTSAIPPSRKSPVTRRSSMKTSTAQLNEPSIVSNNLTTKANLVNTSTKKLCKAVANNRIKSMGSDEMFPEDVDFYNIAAEQFESNRDIRIESPPRFDPTLIESNLTGLDGAVFANEEIVATSAVTDENIGYY